MAIVSIPGGLLIPKPATSSSPTMSFMNATIGAAGEYVAHIITVPKTGTLDKFEIRLGPIPNAPDNGLRFSFQDVDTNGDPDGVADQYRVMASPTANSWAVPGLMTNDGTDGGVKRSVTRGQRIACVVAFENFVAGDVVNVSMLTMANAVAHAEPYVISPTAGTVPNSSPILALKYDDGTYEHIDPNTWPMAAVNAVTYNSGSTPDERGMTFSFPAPVSIGGFWVRGAPTAASVITFVLYEGSNVLETVTWDTDHSFDVVGRTLPLLFAADHQLTANTVYRLTIKPDANNYTLYDFDVASTAIMGSVPGGAEWYYTQRTDSGAWTDTNTKRPFMGLLVTGIENGTVAGLKVHPGMSGGMRG